LNEVWLDKYKEMFVSVWIDKFLNYGNRTTSRAESQHANLKRYLHSSKTNLDTFVRILDEIVKSQFTSIKSTFETSRIERKNKHKVPILTNLHGIVSHEALDIIMGQSKLNPLDCCCQVRTSYGLPCACEVSLHLNAGQYIHDLFSFK